MGNNLQLENNRQNRPTSTNPSKPSQNYLSKFTSNNNTPTKSHNHRLTKSSSAENNSSTKILHHTHHQPSHSHPQPSNSHPQPSNSHPQPMPLKHKPTPTTKTISTTEALAYLQNRHKHQLHNLRLQKISPKQYQHNLQLLIHRYNKQYQYIQHQKHIQIAIKKNINQNTNNFKNKPHFKTKVTKPHLGFAMNQKMTLRDDFTILRVIGKGSFAKVYQVRYKKNGKIYAIKALTKKTLVARKQVIHTNTERRVLENITNPFIVSLRYAFQDDIKLYMVLDYFNGGELFFHLKNDGSFSAVRAQFYSAEICLALECLHSNNIIYRDLKPENILLDMEGHIKITDFGLSKDKLKYNMVTHTFCGTPEYLAPEVLLEEKGGYTKAVDWWSFGTLLYEMCTGLPPFYDENIKKMYDKILHNPIPLPSYLSQNLNMMFIGLLDRNPLTRLGSRECDAYDIKAHAYYANIDWGKLYAKEVKPPFRPMVKDASDTSNIDVCFINEKVAETPIEKSASVLAAQDMFNGFTYNEDNNHL